MRIGVFSESYEPIINGVTVCAQTLRDELCNQGHEVFIFAPGYRGFEDPYAHVFRFPSWTAPIAPDYPLPIPFAPSIKKSFRGLGLDIVHTQTPFLLGMIGARWARQLGIPVVSTNHTHYAEYTHYAPFLPQSLAKKTLIAHLRRYYNGCDAVVAPSQPTREILLSYGVRSRIEVITSGVNNGEVVVKSNGFRERIGVPPDSQALLYVGRLAKEKNLMMLLSAFQLIAKETPNAQLVLVGAGPYEDEIKARAERLGVKDRLIFVGSLPRAELPSVYASADVFVWPSVTETQGLAVCEALSAGLPCVAVKAGGTPECLVDGVDSFLTDNNYESFAGATLRLLKDEDLRSKMASDALRNSLRFSTSEMAANFLEFYSSVISEYKGER
ncbi:MAG: glycosyltransferase family 4 protein [Armatimonadota bacterium]|nr:glycosyltransferase family 4 protein [Armatimonadota bacterium]